MQARTLKKSCFFSLLTCILKLWWETILIWKPYQSFDHNMQFWICTCNTARHSSDLHICCPVVQNENSRLGNHLPKVSKSYIRPEQKEKICHECLRSLFKGYWNLFVIKQCAKVGFFRIINSEQGKKNNYLSCDASH